MLPRRHRRCAVGCHSRTSLRSLATSDEVFMSSSFRPMMLLPSTDRCSRAPPVRSSRPGQTPAQVTTGTRFANRRAGRSGRLAESRQTFRNPSVTDSGRTAIRNQSGPSPGNVSPRRTANPRSARLLADAASPGDLHEHERPPRVRRTSKRPRTQPVQQICTRCRSSSTRSLRRLATRSLVAASNRSGERRSGHRPVRLYCGQLLDQPGRGDAHSPTRSPASPHVLVRLRITTSPGIDAPTNDSGSPGTASMNASSTTRIRSGRASSRRSSARMQDRRRVGRVADHHEVGIGRYRRRVQHEAVLRPQDARGRPGARPTAARPRAR